MISEQRLKWTREVPCGHLVQGVANAKALRQRYVWYVPETTFRSVWWELSEQGEENRGLGGGWERGAADVVRPTKATVGTVAGMRWEALGEGS